MDDQGRPASFLTRLGFLEFVAKGAFIVALGAFLRRREPEKYYPRPPGARPEEQFLSLCLRCDICKEVCPWDVIRYIPVSESIINAGTPVLSGSCRY
jgi:ferredoxin-type protein NapG